MTNIGIEGKLKPLLQNAKIADAIDVEVEASGFDGNLATTDTNVQLVAQKLDDLTLGAMPGTITASDISLTNNFSGVLEASGNVQTALERIDATGIGAAIFAFTGSYTAQTSNIAEWFDNTALSRVRGTGSGSGSGNGVFTFTLPGTTDLNTVFDALVAEGLPEVFRIVIEYTGGAASASFSQNRLTVRPQNTPNPQIAGTTSINLRRGQSSTLEITRASGVISDYVFVAVGLVSAVSGQTLDDIELQNPRNFQWDASANGTLPTVVLKGYAYRVFNAPADGSGRFGEVMQDGDWVIWEGETFTSWDATPHQWFVLAAHDVRRISALENNFLSEVVVTTPVTDRNGVLRGANFTDTNGSINIKAYATQGDYSPADLNTSGDVTERTITPAQTSFLGIRLNGNFSTLESTLPTLYVYAEDTNGNFRILGNMNDDFAFQGNFGSESDYLSNNAFNFANNDVVRVYVTTRADRYNVPNLDISEENLTASVQAKLNRTDGGSTDERARLLALESKMDALFPLTPDVTDLTGWGDIYNTENSTSTVTITDGYSLIADYRGAGTRYESAGVTYDDTGSNVVRYTGLGDNLFRTFGFKVNAPADQVLMWIVDGSELIPFIDMTDDAGTGTYRVNNYTPSYVEDQRVTNETHHITTISGQSTLRAGSTDTATFTVTEYPVSATQTSRSIQIGLDVLVNGSDTQGEHLQQLDIPDDDTAQESRTFDASIYLGPLHNNRTVNVTMSYATRVSGSDLLVDIQLITAPSDVTIRIRDVFTFLSYTAPATVARVDNFQVLNDGAGDYEFTGTNEILITFHPFESQNFTNVVPVAVNASGTVDQLNDVNTPIPANHFGSVEIPDQTALTNFEFRTFAPEHVLVHSDLASLLGDRATQWCYGLAALRAVTEHAVIQQVDFTSGIVLISPNSTRYLLSVDNAGVLSTSAL